jgi:LacI family transcriptional regulator
LVKLKDIAEYLSVSVSTVSRVVNNKDRVDPKTRQKILDALELFNYQPDDNARRLKTNTSNVLGVIIPDISNPFYSSVIKGIEKIAAENSYSVILCNTDEIKERENDAVNLLLREKVAGIIAATIFNQGKAKKIYSNIGCPVVFIDNVPYADDPINYVTIDNVLAADELVRYMINRGHRKVFMITGPEGESSADERLIGWKNALQSHGIIPDNDWFAHGDFREESGRQIMEEFLRRNDRPTAVCVANNFMAYGAIKAIYDAGLSIPADISIGAFDIVDTTGLMKLNITTVIEPAEDIGIIAADICLQASKQKGIKLSRKMILKHDFFENSTVKML